jgi:hypothetical protein
MKRSFSFLAALILAASAWGQTSTSEITGTVTDTTGGVVPGATVTVTNEATGGSNRQTTSQAGVFAFPALTAGTYTISVEAQGFKTEKKTGAILQVGTPLNLPFRMQLGQAAETVEVKESTVELQTESATLGDVVTRQTVSKMPLNGRNIQNLAILLPGAVQTTGGLTIVNGMRNGAQNITVDGIDANESTNPNSNTNLYGLSPDNVQEFKATTSNPTSDEGRNSGLNLALATRSGTNNYHGSVYEFFRNTVLNSSDYYANARGTAKPTLQSNQYGVEFGGPVIRNKTFFFFNYEGQDTNNAPPITSTYGGNVYVYTPSAVQGNFRYFVANPNAPLIINGQKITSNSPLLVDPRTGALAAGVRNCASPTDSGCVQTFNIPANDPQHIGLDPAINKQLASYPAPNGFSGGGATDGLNVGNYFWNSPYYQRGPHFTARVDHTFNENNTVFFRYLYADNNTLNGDPANSRPQVLPGLAPEGTVQRNGGSYVASYRRVVSPTIVNELTLGLSRWHFLFTQGQANPLFPNIPAYTYNTVTTPFLNYPETERGVTTPQVIDNLNVIKGSHIIRMGINFRFYRHNDLRGQPGGNYVTPVISLSASTRPPTGITLPSLATATAAGISSVDLTALQNSINNLLGIPATIKQYFLGNLNTNTYLPFLSGNSVTLFDEGQRLKQYDSFIQDTWKIRSNLTLNYGLRWEVNPAPTEAGGRVYVPNLPIDGSQGPVTFVHADRWFKRNNLDALAPRIGIAYSLNSKTVIRTGYGISFDTLDSFQVTSVAGNVPGIVTNCTATVGGTTTPGCGSVPNIRIGQGFPETLPAPTVQPSSYLTLPAQLRSNAPNVVTFDPNLKLPTVHEWNFTIQRELPGSLILQVGYVGHRGLRLFRAYDINQINAGPILPSFADMQQNVARKCNADGTGCPAGVTGTPVPLVTSGILPASFVNSSTTATDLAQNAAGNFALRIESQTLAAHLRPNQQFAQSVYIDSGGDSYYHSLQTVLRKRFDNGLLISASYSFSKAIDDESTDPVGSSSGGGLSSTNTTTALDISNWRLDRGLSDYNRKHVFIGNWIYEIPVGRQKKYLASIPKFLDAFIGGWSLNGIMTAQSGQPFSVLSGALTANGTHQSYAGQPAGQPLPSASIQQLPGVIGPSLFANASGFVLPAAGSDGIGRNSFTGPSFFNLDASIAKTFTLTERFKLVYRAEVFNVLNHVNFNTGDLSILSPTFGQNLTEIATGSSRNVVLNGEPNRVMQMALRLTF